MKIRHLLAALVFALVSCQTAPTPAVFRPDLETVYTYKAYSSGGQLLLQGTFRFEGIVTVDLATLVQGKWSIAWAPGADRARVVGPQVGEGRFDGATDSSGVKMNLTPVALDAAVLLAGDPTGTGITGSWTYETIAGPVEQGRFTLFRRY